MKALTALPSQAYVQVSEEAKVPLADLLRLVQELETNRSPAYLARYRPDVSAGLDARRIAGVRDRLREFIDLSDRRVTILTAISRQERLTPELREAIENAPTRHDLEDLYLPYKPKRRTPADEAGEKGLEPLARFLWTQEPADADPAAEAAKLQGQAASPEEALAGAVEIIARWLGENPEVRRDLRKVSIEGAEIVVEAEAPVRKGGGKSGGKGEAAAKRAAALVGLRKPALKLPWRQALSIRRAERERTVRSRIEAPREQILTYLKARLLKHEQSAFNPHLERAAERAYEEYLEKLLANETALELEQRVDDEAIRAYSKSLRKLLSAPGAGAVPTIGIEGGRPGGWRAAVVGADGSVLEWAIVREDESKAKAAEAEDEASAPEGGEESASQTPAGQTPEEAPKATESESSEPAAEAPLPLQEQGDGDTSVAAEAPAAEEPAEAAAEEAPPAAGPESASAAEPVEAAQVPAEAPEQTAETPGEAQQAEPEQAAADAAESGAPAEKAAAESDEESAPAAQAEPEASAEGAAPAAQAEVTAAQQSAGLEAEKPAAQAEEKPKRDKPAKKSTPPAPRASLAELIDRHGVELIAIGSGPNARQVERFVRTEARKAKAKVRWTTVNEAGTWIYATSKSARKELPNLDPPARSAASLARRLQDPLAELVKIDPRAAGIGSGLHEVDQKRLRSALEEQVETVVQETGVDVNRAPVELLAKVAGFTERAAKRIVEQRSKKGPFASRKALAATPGLAGRVYDQAAGFLRVPGGEHPLDATGVHPRHYEKLEGIASAAGVSLADAVGSPAALMAVDLTPFVDKDHPEPVLRAMLRELEPRALNNRGELQLPEPTAADIEPLDEVKVGVKAKGVVTNVTDFGVFLDIGAGGDGLLHVSQLSDELLAKGKAAIKPGDRLEVWVNHVNPEADRISLSMREPRESSRQRRVSPEARRSGEGRRGDRPRRGGPRRDDKRAPVRRTFGPDREQQAREEERMKNMSMGEKLSALQDRFRTKIDRG